ncbi:hypothetical protein LXA43DRAFT_1089878 [Ganoderma leucocontextum]|nr:hypothetical protein LXA43DRAFT_1089878 [Ganoderma leucocontextum]
MVPMQVSPKDYMIIASILKDGPGTRCSFTFKELLETFESIGFNQVAKGRWVYNGKVLFLVKRGDKGRATVTYARQDELKSQLLSLFGWAKGTFIERAGL